jgi:hypothetical protein
MFASHCFYHITMMAVLASHRSAIISCGQGMKVLLFWIELRRALTKTRLGLSNGFRLKVYYSSTTMDGITHFCLSNKKPLIVLIEEASSRQPNFAIASPATVSDFAITNFFSLLHRQIFPDPAKIYVVSL